MAGTATFNMFAYLRPAHRDPLGCPLLRDLVGGASEPRRDLLTCAPVGPHAAIRPLVSDHLLEGLQRQRPDDVAGGLGLDRHWLPGERVRPRPRLGGRLAHHLELQEAGDDELTGAILGQLLGDSAPRAEKTAVTSFLPSPVVSASAV